MHYSAYTEISNNTKSNENVYAQIKRSHKMQWGTLSHKCMCVAAHYGNEEEMLSHEMFMNKACISLFSAIPWR